MKELADAPFLDMFSAEFLAAPNRVVDELRRASWVVRTAIGGLVISRTHVQSLLGDRHLRSSILDVVRLQGVDSGPLYDGLSRSLLATEGEDHHRVRRLVSRAFTPRAVEQRRPQMRSTLRSLLAPVATRGRTEFVSDVADHYPIVVMCDLLGVPADDHEQFATWNRAVTWLLSFNLTGHLDEAQWGMENLDRYVSELVARRRADPQDDLVSALVQAEDVGDRLSDEELRTMIASLLFAGYDTTRNQLGLGMWLFATHPDQWALLAARPELAGAAVEEVMRYRGAVGVAPRVVSEDLELDGYRFPAGTILSLSTSAANHDPDAFDRPHDFDITVDREPQLTFGGGPHYCLGASLARAEMQEAFPILAATMAELALDGEPAWRPPFGIVGPESLPLRFRPIESPR